MGRTRLFEILIYNRNDFPVGLPRGGSFKGIIESNNTYIEEVSNLIIGLGINDVGLIGITFKKNSFDIRKSVAISIAARIRKHRIKTFGYDKDMIGRNSNLHQSVREEFNIDMLTSMKKLFHKTKNIIIYHDYSGIRKMLENHNDLTVFDLTGKYKKTCKDSGHMYQSIV